MSVAIFADTEVGRRLNHSGSTVVRDGHQGTGPVASDKRLNTLLLKQHIIMGNKNKTISFRVNEDAFETLREIAEERDISLSAVFRDYVDTLVAHDGQVQVVPKHELENDARATRPRASRRPSKFRRASSASTNDSNSKPNISANNWKNDERYVTELRQRLDELVKTRHHLEDLDRAKRRTPPIASAASTT